MKGTTLRHVVEICESLRMMFTSTLSGLFDHEITLKILEFIINLIEKVKPGFLLSSMCMFPKSNRKNPNLTGLTPKFRYFADQNRPNGGTHENEF